MIFEGFFNFTASVQSRLPGPPAVPGVLHLYKWLVLAQYVQMVLFTFNIFIVTNFLRWKCFLKCNLYGTATACSKSNLSPPLHCTVSPVLTPQCSIPHWTGWDWTAEPELPLMVPTQHGTTEDSPVEEDLRVRCNTQ